MLKNEAKKQEGEEQEKESSSDTDEDDKDHFLPPPLESPFVKENIFH